MRVTDKNPHERLRPWLWFVGLYLASLLTYAAVTFLPYLMLRH